MKTLRLFAMLLAISAGAFAGEISKTTRYVIGLSPFLENSTKDDIYRRIVGMVLEDMPVKSSLAIYDAFHLTNVTHVEIPDARAFQSGKTRANQFKGQIRALRDFLAAEHPRPSAPQLKDAIRFPQFMDFVAENIGQPASVVVIGSPLYVDPKEPGFSMLEGYFPSDGHLLADRDRSVFGLKARDGSLREVTVHFGYLGDPWVSAIHQEKIARFWHLYLRQQGGNLATFCGDLATLFAAARANEPPRETRFELDRSQAKVEMLRVSRTVDASDWITRDVLANPRPAPPTKTTGPMKIGIRWKDQLDLDLYAAANADAETLFFEHTRAPEGYYFKDHRSSPDREYEFIEFEAPVNVHDVDARINFYKGDAPGGASGEIRIEFDGRIYSGRFQIEAERGNRGRAGASQRQFWSRIDVPGILGLEPPRR